MARIPERSSFQPTEVLYIVCFMAKSTVSVGGEGKH